MPITFYGWHMSGNSKYFLSSLKIQAIFKIDQGGDFHEKLVIYSMSRKECNESLKQCFLKAIMTTSKFVAHADEVTSQL